MDQSFILIFCTVPDEKSALFISRTIVEEKLAACSSVTFGIESVYSWKNAVQQEQERLLIIKTRSDLFDKLQEKILKIHPYEVPEIIAFPIIKGNPEYLKWIDENVKKS
jgi:periplasmic divalent cation tolerance protein